MTSTSLDRSGGDSFKIPEIVQLARSGLIRVPTFQRQFVWGAKEVRDLFDSIYRGFPIGTLLLWRRSMTAPPGLVHLGPISIDVESRSDALWVVDGQQRITSLFAALSPNHRNADDRFEVYFDLTSKKFINPRRGVVPPRAIPVREAMETRPLLNWLRRHADELDVEDFDLADRLGGAIRDYTIPAYIVHGDDQTLLREVFDRVNSAGKSMSRAEVFHALFANNEQPGSARSVIQELRPLGFGRIDENRIVQSLLAVRGGDVQRDVHEEFNGNPDDDPADWYDQTEQALVRSINFMKNEGVPHLLLLPSTLPIPVLATFFYLHPDPEPWILRLLSRWLWRGWVNGFGRESGQTPTMRRAIRSVNPDHLDQESAPSAYDAVKALLDYVPDRDAPRLSLNDFKTNFANSRLLLLAMVAQKPRDPNGAPLDIAAELEQHGVAAVTNFVRGHTTNAAARGFWTAEDLPRLRTLKDASVLKTHLIDERAQKALVDGNSEQFLRERGEILAEVSYQFLDSRMEPGSTIRPSLRDLALAGAVEDDSP